MCEKTDLGIEMHKTTSLVLDSLQHGDQGLKAKMEILEFEQQLFSFGFLFFSSNPVTRMDQKMPY